MSLRVFAILFVVDSAAGEEEGIVVILLGNLVDGIAVGPPWDHCGNTMMGGCITVGPVWNQYCGWVDE